MNTENIITKETFTKSLDAWMFPLLNKLTESTNRFNKSYAQPYHITDLKLDDRILSSIRVHLETLNYDDLLNHLPDTLDLNKNKITIGLRPSFGLYQETGIIPFGCFYQIKIVIENNEFKILMDDIHKRDNLIESGELKNILSEEKIKEVNAKWFEVLENHIKVNRYSYEN